MTRPLCPACSLPLARNGGCSNCYEERSGKCWTHGRRRGCVDCNDPQRTLKAAVARLRVLGRSQRAG